MYFENVKKCETNAFGHPAREDAGAIFISRFLLGQGQLAVWRTCATIGLGTTAWVACLVMESRAYGLV